ERLVKWVRRRPATAALVAVSVLALLSLLGVGIWYNARLRVARDRAEQRSRLARRAVNDMYTDVAENWLGDEPGMGPLQRRFVERAARIYEELGESDDAEQDPDLLRDNGVAQTRLGRLYDRLGRHVDAEKAFDRAITIQRDLLDKGSSERDNRADL